MDHDPSSPAIRRMDSHRTFHQEGLWGEGTEFAPHILPRLTSRQDAEISSNQEVVSLPYAIPRLNQQRKATQA